MSRVDLPLCIFIVGNCGLPLLFLSLNTQVTHHFKREVHGAACQHLEQVEGNICSCLCRGIYLAGCARLQPSVHCAGGCVVRGLHCVSVATKQEL